MNSRNALRLFAWTGFLVFGCQFAAAQEKIGLKVPDGFKVSLYADDDLAHDIYSMTIDSLGRVVVSGQGYVRILIDSDSDGVADEAKQFTGNLKTGAQGMFFHGRHLICSGDDGLLIFRDDNSDDVADGDPEVFLRMATGAEHNTHAIRRGPDGWWYVISGNTSGVTQAYASLPTSPIKMPVAGTLMRIQPDFNGGEVIGDGFRNAYDFAFNRYGEIFTFDSDGERDISLPWYRPTRVFAVQSASNAGWVSRSWKRPGYYLDMPPVIGAFGRGSPTGVVTYDHEQFPQKYRGGLFVLDWTFGRVLSLPLRQSGDTWLSDPSEFVTGVGQFGFAPTDIAVGPDGSLYISVGGRGTRGGVYRIYRDDYNPEVKEYDVGSVDSVLKAHQPLSAWSRAEWMSAAEQLGREPFLKAVANTKRSADERVRAIEVLTEMFGGPDASTLTQSGQADAEMVRARAAWAIGRMSPAKPDVKLLKTFLVDDNPYVVRCALEALQGAGDKTDFPAIRSELLAALGADERYVRSAASHVVARMPQSEIVEMVKQIDRKNAKAVLSLLYGRMERKNKLDLGVLETCIVVLESKFPADVKLDAARLMQLSLGDMGPSGLDAVFDGYASVAYLKPKERELDTFRTRLARVFPGNEEPLDQEIARVISMLSPVNTQLIGKMLDKIDAGSDPVADFHYLIVLSRVDGNRNSEQTKATAAALINLQPKLIKRAMNQDQNWDDRVRELYRTLTSLDADLPTAIVGLAEFGLPGHVPYLSEISEDQMPAAVKSFEDRIRKEQDYRWTNDVVFVLGKSKDPETRKLIRDQYENFEVRNATVIVLAKNPAVVDRPKFVEGLNASQVEVLRNSVDALTKLGRTNDPVEVMTLLRTARRLGANEREFKLREDIMRLLQNNTDQSFGYQFGEEGHKPQPDALAKWSKFLSDRHPEIASQADSDGTNLQELAQLLSTVNWDSGDVANGGAVFKKRQCAQCHGGSTALGPDLAGAASRFSRDDLFTAIAAPNRDVSPRYQTETIETTRGKLFTGLVIYQSIDGVILRNATNQTYRIEGHDIESRHRSNLSLMPTGLLKDLSAQELADLYAYIRTLSAQKTANRDDVGDSR
jgi:putative membrane-bound dehydrogenase-like protein